MGNGNLHVFKDNDAFYVAETWQEARDMRRKKYSGGKEAGYVVADQSGLFQCDPATDLTIEAGDNDWLIKDFPTLKEIGRRLPNGDWSITMTYGAWAEFCGKGFLGSRRREMTGAV